MTRPAARTTGTEVNPEYACGQCGNWHTGPCPASTHRQLGDLLARMVRESDARILEERRVRRTLQEMAPGYECQPVLTLHRPVMADDACPLCGRWSCNGSDCPPSSLAPTSAPDSGMQCDVCGGTFGAAPLPPAGAKATSPAPTAWTCSACQNNGY
jgi:hypothetical protein